MFGHLKEITRFDLLENVSRLRWQRTVSETGSVNQLETNVSLTIFTLIGITANKEILRLLVQYRNEPTLIDTVIQPLWARKPHPDVRACLIVSLLHFLDKCGQDETSPIWTILEQAAEDDYLPVIHALFVRTPRESPWVLTRLGNSDSRLFRTFVNRIQFRVIDHPNKLDARLHAWSRVDYNHCDLRELFHKAKELCVQFNKKCQYLLWRRFCKDHSCLSTRSKSSSE